MKNLESIESRRLRFSHDNSIPRYWNDNCPIKTHFLNAIAMLAPSFERLVISSVVPYKNSVTDPTLSEQVAGFIGQEGAHCSEFIRYNHTLKAQGYEVKQLEKRNLKKYKWLSDKFSPLTHLSLSLAGEHLTAIISDMILRDPKWLDNASPQYAALWRWHAIEEIEHKAVLFDVYKAVGGGYWRRILGMWLITTRLGGLLIRNFFYLVKKDGLLFSGRFWAKAVLKFWVKPGIIVKLVFPYLRYYLPFFHPWQQDNQSLIESWKSQFKQANSFEEMVQILENT